MKKVIRWIGRGLLGLLALLVLAVAVVWVLGGRVVSRTYELPPTAFAVGGGTDLDEGERLARIAGCVGCHGEAVEGQVFFEQPLLATFVAPDLTMKAAEYTDAQLAQVIRGGVRPDGRSVWVMPSDMYAPMTDAHLARIVAWIRSQPSGTGLETRADFALGRIFILLGLFEPAAERVTHSPWPRDPGPDDPDEWGRYLALTACTECHGADLNGPEDGSAPSLSIVGAYPLEAFRTLLATGVPMGGHELDLMAEVARGRFVHFTDAEVEALHGYLGTLAGAPAGDQDG